MVRQIASLSLDLDNKWSYMKIHGDPGWEKFPSYLDLVVPRILDFFESFQLTVTVFVVGQDAALEKNHAALAAIAKAGHEIGNHSFHHEPWLHLFSEQRVETELADTERHVRQVCGQHPIGFRGPGYSISDSTLRVLARRGYMYDASTLPTFLGPLARAYYFLTSRMSRQEKEQRKLLFGRFRDGFKPLRAYPRTIDHARIVEIPVTTMPLLRLPIHFSYLLYLRRFSPMLARIYFRTALALCRATRVEPSLLLHPLDFLGYDDEPDLAFFPAMDLAGAAKLNLLTDAVHTLRRHYHIVTMADHARCTLSRLGLSDHAEKRVNGVVEDSSWPLSHEG